MSVVSEPLLTSEERARLEQGAALFNDGFYFECHDVLEELWSGLRGPGRDFVQALIQVAVGHYHLGNGNREGARSMFARALVRFSAYPGLYLGFDLAAEREALHARLGRLAAEPGGTEADAARTMPAPWRFSGGQARERG